MGVYTYSAHLGIEKACSKVVGDRRDEALYLRALRARGRLACLLHLQFDISQYEEDRYKAVSGRQTCSRMTMLDL